MGRMDETTTKGLQNAIGISSPDSIPQPRLGGGQGDDAEVGDSRRQVTDSPG